MSFQIQVLCDAVGCDAEEDVPTTNDKNWVVVSGWMVDGEYHYCPTCKGDFLEDQKECAK